MTASTSNDGNEGSAEPLSPHRQAIVVRSVLIGAAKMLPLPGVADLLGTALTRGLIYHIAQQRYVDIEENAVEALIAPAEKQGRLNILSTLGSLLSLLRRGRMRRLFAGLAVLHGIEEGVRAFHLGTLLDHYCAQFHTGAAIRVEDARRLRQAMEASTRSAQRALGSAMLNEMITQGQRFFQTVPPWIWAQLSRSEAMPPLPAFIALAHEAKNALRVVSVDRYFGHLIRSFDQQWSKATV